MQYLSFKELSVTFSYGILSSKLQVSTTDILNQGHRIIGIWASLKNMKA